jgi:hypothetical protein
LALIKTAEQLTLRPEVVKRMWDLVFSYWLMIPFYFFLKYDRPHLFNFEKKFGKYGFIISLALIAITIVHIKLMISAFS